MRQLWFDISRLPTPVFGYIPHGWMPYDPGVNDYMVFSHDPYTLRSRLATSRPNPFWKPWPAVELKKVLSVTKHGFAISSSKPRVNQTLDSGADPGFFLGGGAEYQLYKKTAGHLRGMRIPCTLPLDPPLTLEIYKAFQDRLTCLNRHMIV